MIGDIVEVKPHHLPPAQKILELTGDALEQSQEVFAISVGGESGSGKSTLSLAIKKVLEKKGYHAFIFHLDDYFKLPPEDNHEQRVADISNVGPHEVNLELLQEHIDQVKAGTHQLKKPLVHYRENQIRDVIVEFDDLDVVIVEGTYATMLQHVDCKVFMLRNYLDTHEARAKRARDPMLPFIEEVLKIEHEILQKHSPMADILVDKHYNVHRQESPRQDQ